MQAVHLLALFHWLQPSPIVFERREVRKESLKPVEAPHAVDIGYVVLAIPGQPAADRQRFLWQLRRMQVEPFWLEYP